MAQPTGCESTELHGEGETTPRDGATPPRTSSSDSEATIVESLLTTLDSSTMATATKKRLFDELRVRGLRCSTRKDEVIARLIRANTTRQALEPTDSSTNDQAADDDESQAHLEMLSTDNARLRAELNSLRAQLNCATASEQLIRHCTTAPTKTRNAPPRRLFQRMGENHPWPRSSPRLGTPTTSPIQIHFTSDTSSSIPTFSGTPQQSAHEWIAQVERIAALAHCTPSLTLVMAASRLTRSAKDWHSAYGSQHDTWEQWKEALTHRFKRKLTMQEFLDLHTKRRLQSHETIVEYMYSKNAILNKAPYLLAEEERICLILSGIEDDTWANPLPAQLCGTVTELIDRAALLDARRRMSVCADNDKKPPPSTTSRGQGSNQRVPASSSVNLPTANSRSDSSGAQRRGPPLLVRASTAATSVTCPMIVASRKRQQRSERTRNERRGTTAATEQGLHASELFFAFDGRHITNWVRGANISIMSANALTDDIPTQAWVSREDIEVLSRSIRPTLAATLDVTLGPTNVVVDLILGSDWRRVASVDVTFDTSNDVTIVPVEPTGKSSSSEVPPPKQGTPHRTGETLIASFCRQSNENVFKDDGFMRLNTKCPAPDEDFTSLFEDVTRSITKDATEAERDQRGYGTIATERHGRRRTGAIFGRAVSNEEVMRLALVHGGPIAVGFEVYPDFQAYSGGVYQHTTLHRQLGAPFDPFELTNHAVLVVGYGFDEHSQLPYWTVKNSWGPEWGESGFFRIRRGNDECGIESLAVEVEPIP
ncbi:hypothetical protein HPB52_023543 [Rhipicephalus sanguineus]|uniref:Peptidase C1A papain C-terminal domain-containing protein n=1 Tax=Rhipicephalus sanguineus TaxID=34632 RepID=A0A9D4SR34_RHISA|nr:hypothetical protein HPB52_023543 [Rhipicephalus sanguineus]